MTAEIGELRPLPAAGVLAVWRSCREIEDALERTLRCNARVLAACCFLDGEPVFRNETAVLEGLTGREMAELLGRLAAEDGGGPAGMENPAFDMERFRALEG